MSASVTVHHKAFGDRRIAYLGELAGYSTREALGAMVMLWSRCTELQTDRPGAIEIRSCIGRNGDELLIECGLGERTAGGEVRVKGCDGMIEWYGQMQERASLGGKARAAGAVRGTNGRFLPAGDQPEASPNPGSESDPDLDPEEDPPAPAHAIPGTDTVAVPEGQPPEPTPPELLVKALENTDKALRERQQLRSAKWQKLEEIRSAIARELGVEIRPLAAQDPGERSLAMRIREAPSLARAAADIDHVLAIYAAEARRDDVRSVQWLTGAMFEERSWRRALGMTLADATAPKRAGPRLVPPSTDTPRRIKTLGQG